MADSISKLIPNRFEIKNASELNSLGSEFGIIPYNHGNIFISDRVGEEEKGKSREQNKNIYHWTDRGYLKMYYLEQDTVKGTSKISAFDGISKNLYHTGPMVLNKKQDLIFYTVAKKVNPKLLSSNKIEIRDFINRLEIFYSRKLNGTWTSPIPLPFNNVLIYSVGHPALSPDEKTLYFISDMPGGKNGTDIFYSEIGEGSELTFGVPVNAGSVINTEGNERFPVFQPNGDFYFSSDGLLGLGGLDIFRTRGEKNRWLKPANLGAPVNSSKDDFGFLTQGKDIVGGYFTSNREGGQGSDDLYYFLQIRPLLPLESPDGMKMSQDSLIYAQIQKNEFPKDSLEYLKLYSARIKQELIKMDSDAARNLRKIRLEQQKNLNNKVGHNFGEYLVNSKDAKEADSVALIMINNPNARLTIIGHADPRGSNDFNQNLSQKRALELMRWMMKLGINKNRIKVAWKGADSPLYPCAIPGNCTEEEFARNRRTELNISGLPPKVIFESENSPDSLKLTSMVKDGKMVSRKQRPHLEMAVSVKNTRISEDSLSNTSSKIPTDKITQEDLNILKDSVANHNELFNAFGEMTIDTVFLNSRNLLVIRETDGTIQRVFLPKRILDGDQLIRDQVGNQWIIRRNRRVVKVKKEK